ncbi:nuclear transport factor 2 family protein [Segniliparus rotundus]|uniref:Rv0361 family membrane protein n=1 Tax=Segniliparus rotundus TaxID=286802 RepID=UPI00031D4BE6|nr:nuclear transport factor 2 family protein [Segniliparus rotundus]
MKPQNNRRLWRLSAALAVVLVFVAGGGVLRSQSKQRHAAAVRTEDGDVRLVVTSYFAALRDGDLDALRELTCPGYHNGFFDKADPGQYKAVHENEASTGDVLVLESVDAVLLAEPSAQAKVTARPQSAPQSQQMVFTLRKANGKWQICEPQAPAPSSTSARR